MVNFRTSRKSYILFMGFFLLMSQSLFACWKCGVDTCKTPDTCQAKPHGGFYLSSSDPKAIEIENAKRDLDQATKSLAENPSNQELLKKVQTAQSRYNDLTGRSFKSGFCAPFNNKYSNINSISAFFGLVICSCTLFPFVEKVSAEVSNQLSGSMSNWFYYLFGGLISEISRETLHTKNTFKSFRDVIALVTRLSAREVGAAMDARARITAGATGSAGAAANKDGEAEKACQNKCAVCDKAGQGMEYFFACTGEHEHGIHPECAIKFFSTGKNADKVCPTCKAERKFDVMEPDVVISSLIDKLRIKSELSSHILIFKSTERKINSLIRQMNKSKNKNKKLTERTMLLAISMDLRNMSQLLGKVLSNNDFYNQETLKKLDVTAAIGWYNCDTLLNYINNINNGAKNELGLRREGQGYPGGGIGGFGP